MWLIVANLAVLLVVPLLLLFWLARPSRSVVVWVLKAAAVGGYVVSAFYAGPWQVLSYYGRYVLLAMFAAAALFGTWRMRTQPFWARPQRWQWLGPALAALLLLLSVPMLLGVMRAHRVPPDPVALTFPLRDGAFYVASGGSHALMNPHMKVAAPELQAWRGQLWALDIVALYPSGNRARGLYPADLGRYAIFGEPVYAPCDGRIEAVETQLPDLVPPATDTTNKAGNYVLLRCGPEAYVVLAHLKEGSITVAPGESVAVGARLGAIGNSGNTSEPHLHINAQRSAGGATPIDADPRPMTFRGAFPIRNDVVHP